MGCSSSSKCAGSKCRRSSSSVRCLSDNSSASARMPMLKRYNPNESCTGWSDNKLRNIVPSCL
eukprot:scaffold24393_cov112-Isochrysis_galbana.AAC.9